MAELPFKSETALCETFIAAADKRVWLAYPETQGWDILMVRRRDGLQIGIQAKLRLNIEVINQSLDSLYGSALQPGPDCRAVLVPAIAAAGAFDKICRYIGVVIIRMRSGPHYLSFDPALPDGAIWATDHWPGWGPTQRLKLPEYVPDVAAGAKSPLQLTEWKIKAIKLLILLERNGKVNRSDFKSIGLDHRQWTAAGGWLAFDDRVGGYVRNTRTPNYKKAHPKNYAQIAADFEKWKPKQCDLLGRP